MSLLKTSAIDSDGSLQIKSAGNTRITLTTDGDIDLNGNLTGLTELSVDGNINASGYIFEKKTSFVPNQTGWWRVYEGTFFSGTLVLSGNFPENNSTMVTLAVSASPYNQDSSIMLLSKTGVNHGGTINKVRVSNNNGGSVYIDLYVQGTSTGTMYVYAYGPNVTDNLLSSPVHGVSAGIADEVQIELNNYAGVTPVSSVYWLSNPTTGVLGSKIHHDNGNLIFNNDFNTERVRIKSTGGMGIGSLAANSYVEISTPTDIYPTPILNLKTPSISAWAGPGYQGSMPFITADNVNGNFRFGLIGAYNDWDESSNYFWELNLGSDYGDDVRAPMRITIDTTRPDNLGYRRRLSLNENGTWYTNIHDYPGLTSTQNSKTNTFPAYFCRAWVNFNGTGTVAIRGSGNVSSITDHGTGLFTVNFTTAMPDANYSACFLNGYGSASTNDRYHVVGFDDNVTAPAAGSCRIRTATVAASLADVAYITVAFFR